MGVGSSGNTVQAMDYVSEWNKLLALWAMVGQNQNQNHNSVNGSEESGRESLQSGSPLGLQICDQNESESSPQPLNLSLTTKPIKDHPYDHHHEFGVKDLYKNGGMKRKKKVRTTFTGRQIFELEKMFETKKVFILFRTHR